MLPTERDLIAAIATPPGIGGVGIIRVSGENCDLIAQKILSNYKKLFPNLAIYSKFLDKNQNIIDEGIAIFFKNPNSFTGEDVLEIHAHGGPVILNMLLNRIIELGARIAEPGEFTKRAFLANKIDLIQAESIANLINAQTEAAAIAATKSLQGAFSKQINLILDDLVNIRAYIEAIIDFPEEDIDALSISNITQRLNNLILQINKLLLQARAGALLTQGIKATIIGRPNVGKSSLLNCLSGVENAIVTEIPGTTRDLIKAKINLDGIIIEFIDTAGLRETNDLVEQIGVEKAIKEIATTDLIILMLESTEFLANKNNLKLETILPIGLDPKLINNQKIIILINKIDLIQQHPEYIKKNNLDFIFISAKHDLGIDLLKNHIKELCGLHLNNSQSTFMANARHVQALNEVLLYLNNAQSLLATNFKNMDLLAEDLRIAQDKLSKITGIFSNEDLLSIIFSEFCIGK